MAEIRRIVTEDDIRRFQQHLSGFNRWEIRKIYEHYFSDLEHVLNSLGCITFLSEMTSRMTLREASLESSLMEHYITLEKQWGTLAFASAFLQDVRGMREEVMMGLWESLFVLQRDHPHPNLLGMVEEIKKQGHFLVEQIILDRNGHQLAPSMEVIQALHKQNLQEKTEKMVEFNAPGSPDTPGSFCISERYLDLRIVASNQFRKQSQHELMEVGGKYEIYMQKKQSGLEHITPDKLFRWCHRSGSTPHAVVVSGVPGVGKTTLMQKFVYDWINGKHYQRFTFVLFFKFRDFNVSKKVSLESMIRDEFRHLGGSLCSILQDPERLLFIFDGLDESVHQIDFTTNLLTRDTQIFLDLGVIVASLVQQTLLKGCSVLITSRPTRLTAIDIGVFKRVCEIMGFFPQERERYFEDCFKDAQLAKKAFHYVRENDTLYTFCYIPSYCWITCTVLSKCLQAGKLSDQPKTVTQLFAIFISHILSNHSQNRDGALKLLRSIGQLAEYGVLNQKLFFDSEELEIFNQVSNRQLLSSFFVESKQPSGTTYSYIHLTIQEFVGALPHFIAYLCDDLQKLLENASGYRDGRGDMLLRFLIGLSDTGTMGILKPYLGPLSIEASKHIIGWLRKFAHSAWKKEHEDKREILKLFAFLFESRNGQLVSEAFGLNMRFDLTEHHLTSLDCTMLSFILGSCREIECLDLDTCYIHSEGLRRLTPVLSKIKDVRLANNDLKDEDMELIYKTLASAGCRISHLSLRNNAFTDESCTSLACALTENHSLRKLDISRNNMAGQNFEVLVTALSNQKCRIQHLLIQQIKLTDEHAALLRPLGRKRNLQSLDLSKNYLTDSSSELLAQIIEESPSLTEIRIDSNEFSDDQKTYLKCLEQYKSLNVST